MSEFRMQKSEYQSSASVVNRRWWKKKAPPAGTNGKKLLGTENLLKRYETPQAEGNSERGVLH